MASKYLQKYPVPPTFPEVLHDFFRDQPKNIYDFGYEYFKAIEEGKEFDYKNKGKAIPPPKDREPSQGNYKEMAEGVKP
eukprot:CAMPEP_0176371420 /NCGR_PEP_ID=MMETSP0126-20121128/24683_1 /TAXON_ID=141414 ORGANISM="Strombidinopsis acuminatum, Strain SPMC142" /NCGR_SAMPLE_ID=MMETSP0126 /ASSEMBLY_ACC=CAM_ASM_000229 /LENGTH=78 /DNA_ID=CAMNT_0017730865 /DNA_START=12 /DNA_END=248 /DNA_ORIENTATION=-